MSESKLAAAPATRAARQRAASAAWAAALVLSGCGGGVYLGWGFDESPPAVTLTTAATSVQAGQSVRFVAAATDENGIDQVSLYRLDGAIAVHLGTDSAAPYEWLVTAPGDGRTSLSVFARARDNSGNRADSDTVTIAVIP
ncbi:MAG TPA: Ig-like domain-containing protein [Albitalea sp.]